VRPWFERTFRPYGLPHVLRTDNGTPFATTGARRLSRLAVWWSKLGIQLDRIDPGHPEQNGRHERFHLTLQQEATTPPRARRGSSSRRGSIGCGRNSMRCGPMKALGQQPPTRHYVPAPRPYPTRLAEPWYDATDQVRRVKDRGWIKWHGDRIFISEAVRGGLVGITETPRGDWLVRFLHVELGRIDRQTRRFRPGWHGRRPR
jgi:putative transposase